MTIYVRVMTNYARAITMYVRIMTKYVRVMIKCAREMTKYVKILTKKGTSRQRSGKGAIRERFPLQKPRWEKTKLTIRYLYHKNIS